MHDCRECGKRISDEAGSCPNCGAPIKGNLLKGKHGKEPVPPILKIIFGIMILGFLIYQFSGEGSKHQPSAPDGKPVVVGYYQASDIIQAYKSNVLSADKKFKGNVVGISGTIVDINTDILGSPYLVIVGDSQQDRIRIEFGKEYMDYVTSLSTGEDVSLACLGHGSLMGMPLMENCHPNNQ